MDPEPLFTISVQNLSTKSRSGGRELVIRGDRVRIRLLSEIFKVQRTSTSEEIDSVSRSVVEDDGVEIQCRNFHLKRKNNLHFCTCLNSKYTSIDLRDDEDHHPLCPRTLLSRNILPGLVTSPTL